MGEKFRLQVKDHFDAAHHLEDYPGKCARVHGHRWDVEVVVEGTTLGALNMLIDFGDVKTVLKGVLNELLDHYDINVTLHEKHPTAEFIARWLYKKLDVRIKQLVEDTDVHLSRVCIWESPECCVKYYETKDNNGKS